MTPKRLLAPLLALLVFAPHLGAGEAEPLRIHLISGSREYKSEASLKAFSKVLEEEFEASVTASWVSDGATGLGDMEPIRNADLLVIFARRMKLPDEQIEVVRRHWEAGKPVVGIRTASHAFSRDVNEVFDKRVLGNHYSGHYGDEPVRVKTTEAGAEHPVLEGVGEITSRKLYKAGKLAEGATVLQLGDNGKGTQPVTLVNEFNGGRMLYTSLGVPEDFQDEDFRRLLVNAVRWTAKAEQ